MSSDRRPSSVPIDISRADLAVPLCVAVEVVVLVTYIAVRKPTITSPHRVTRPFLWIRFGTVVNARTVLLLVVVERLG